MGPLLRNATASDRDRIAAIYTKGIVRRTATFETEPRLPSDIAGWLDPGELLVVAELAAEVVAFARTSPYRARPCYAGIREFSVYVDAGMQGLGLGLAIMRELIDQARQAGIHKLVARIFPENTASLNLCDRLGFRPVGIYEKHGQLDGEWRDCVIVELVLKDAA